jgi:hypothetical protein
MPKGEKLKAKANGSATTCEILEIVELELLICQKCSYCPSLASYGENVGLWEKGGVFGS